MLNLRAMVESARWEKTWNLWLSDVRGHDSVSSQVSSYFGSSLEWPILGWVIEELRRAEEHLAVYILEKAYVETYNTYFNTEEETKNV